MSSTTFNFIVLENFYCISRPHLIENRITKLTCESIMFSVTIIIIATIAIDIFDNVPTGLRIFQGFTGFELFWLAISARYTKETSISLEALNTKYPLHKEGVDKLNSKTNNLAALSLLSIILDVIGLKVLEFKSTTIVFLCVSFAAHDAELAYFSLLVENLIMKLEMLKSVSPTAGSKDYSYILTATSHLSEQFTPRLLLLLGITLFTTVAYQFLLILAGVQAIPYLAVYLLWRESKAMYSLWLVCSAVSRSNNVCKELALYLVRRLTADENLSKNKTQYKIVERWYYIVRTQQPRYISGTVLSISLSTPILVIDLSINYMLIIVQMYQAYK